MRTTILTLLIALAFTGCVKAQPDISCPKCDVVFENGEMSYVCGECSVKSVK